MPTADGVSISKSVARAFRLLELFRDRRRPMTAAEICRRLSAPQPSVRALLVNLASLGYLVYMPADRSWQPTARVAALGDWLRQTPLVSPGLLRTVDSLAAESGETTSLCTICGLRAEILHVSLARHPVAVQLQPGIGAKLWQTAVGRTLLSQCPATEVATMLDTMRHDERSVAGRRSIKALAAELPRIRRAGWYAGYDLLLEGVGSVCVPVSPRTGTMPLVVAIAGLRDRVRPVEARLLRMIRGALCGQPAGPRTG